MSGSLIRYASLHSYYTSYLVHPYNCSMIKEEPKLCQY